MQCLDLLPQARTPSLVPEPAPAKSQSSTPHPPILKPAPPLVPEPAPPLVPEPAPPPVPELWRLQSLTLAKPQRLLGGTKELHRLL